MTSGATDSDLAQHRAVGERGMAPAQETECEITDLELGAGTRVQRVVRDQDPQAS